MRSSHLHQLRRQQFWLKTEIAFNQICEMTEISYNWSIIHHLTLLTFNQILQLELCFKKDNVIQIIRKQISVKLQMLMIANKYSYSYFLFSKPKHKTIAVKYHTSMCLKMTSWKPRYQAELQLTEVKYQKWRRTISNNFWQCYKCSAKQHLTDLSGMTSVLNIAVHKWQQIGQWDNFTVLESKWQGSAFHSGHSGSCGISSQILITDLTKGLRMGRNSLPNVNW